MKKLAHSSLPFFGSHSTIQISLNQRRVLAAIQTDGELSIPELAKRAGLKPHAFRFALQKLQESQIIRRRLYINPYTLGYNIYGFFFTLTSRGVSEKAALIDFLVKNPCVTYVGEIGGQYQLKADIMVKSLLDYARFFDTFEEQFGVMVEHKSTATILSLTDYPLKCLGTPSSQTPKLQIGIQSKQENADSLDLLILSELASSRDPTPSSIARTLGEPLSTITYRLESLKQRNILVGTHFLIDFSRLGFSSFFFKLSLRSAGQKAREQVMRLCQNNRSIYYAVNCIGNWDFEIGISVENAAEIISIGEEFSKTLGNNLASMEMVPLLRYFKVINFPCG